MLFNRISDSVGVIVLLFVAEVLVYDMTNSSLKFKKGHGLEKYPAAKPNSPQYGPVPAKVG